MSTKNISEGKLLDIYFDAKKCLDTKVCIHADSALVVESSFPQCHPDAVSCDEAVHTVEQCPTGALSYQRHDGIKEKPPSTNTITVGKDYSFYIRGDFTILTQSGTIPISRAVLCSCDTTKNKPFCDNSHRDIPCNNQQNVMTLPMVQDDCTVEDNKVSIELRASGSLRVRGHVTLITDQGTLLWQGTKVSLCGCGHSQNKPFCDGRHKEMNSQ